MLFEYPSELQVMFWNHLFHGLLFLLQVFHCCEGGGLGSLLHIEVGFLGVGVLSCCSGYRARREASPFLIHGELAIEVAAGEIDSRVPPVNIGVVMLQPVMS